LFIVTCNYSPKRRKPRKGEIQRKAKATSSQFQLIHDEIPHMTRLRQIGLYFGSDLEQDVAWADEFLHTNGVSRQNHFSYGKSTEIGSGEQQKGGRTRVSKRRIPSGRYKATMTFNGVYLNLRSDHSTSAEAAAALDLGRCLLKGSEYHQVPNVLSRPELISGLKAAGVPNCHGNRVDPLPSFKVDEVTKQWFESIVESALTSLGGMDYQLSYMLAAVNDEKT
jgi:hypothetical protein